MTFLSGNGGAGTGAPGGNLSAIYPRDLTLHGVFFTRSRARLEATARLTERGERKPLVDEVLPLEEVRRAHEQLDSGHGLGKIVLRVAKEQRRTGGFDTASPRCHRPCGEIRRPGLL